MLEETCYRRHVVQRFRFDEARDLLYFPLAGIRRVLDRKLADYLLHCSGFLPLNEHLRAIQHRFRLEGDALTEAETFLKIAVREGLLISQRNLKDRLQSSPQGHCADCRVSSVAFLAAGRHGLLSRAIGSYLESGYAPDNPARVLVLMDGRINAGVSRFLGNAAASLGKNGPAQIILIDTPEKEAWCEQLARESGIPLPGVRFALLGDWELDIRWRAGANRNCFLLATAGELALCCDEDTVVSDGVHAHGHPILATLQPDPTVIRFHADVPAPPARLPDESRGLRAAHERYLGRHLGMIIGECRAGGFLIDEGGCADRLLRDSQGGGITIGVTQSGIAGDCGIDSSLHLIATANSESHAQLASSPEFYRRAIDGRQITRIVPSVTLTPPGGLLLTAAAGFDNRQPLPPFPPILRNEEAVFSAALSSLHPAVWSAHLPVAVSHLPGRRSNMDEAQALRLPAAQVLIGVLNCASSHACVQAGARDFAGLGEDLTAVARLPDSEFQDLIRSMVTTWQLARCEMLERVMSRFASAPDYWARDIERMIRKIRQLVQQDETLLPPGLPGFHSLKEFLRSYGEMLCFWPQLRDAARRLGDKGIHPGIIVPPA